MGKDSRTPVLITQYSNFDRFLTRLSTDRLLTPAQSCPNPGVSAILKMYLTAFALPSFNFSNAI